MYLTSISELSFMPINAPRHRGASSTTSLLPTAILSCIQRRTDPPNSSWRGQNSFYACRNFQDLCSDKYCISLINYLSILLKYAHEISLYHLEILWQSRGREGVSSQKKFKSLNRFVTSGKKLTGFRLKRLSIIGKETEINAKQRTVAQKIMYGIQYSKLNARHQRERSV